MEEPLNFEFNLDLIGFNANLDCWFFFYTIF